MQFTGLKTFIVRSTSANLLSNSDPILSRHFSLLPLSLSLLPEDRRSRREKKSSNESLMEPTSRKLSASSSPPSGSRSKPATLSSLHKEISMILSHWIGLQMAIDNQWGGLDSFNKYEQLASDIYTFFSRSKEGVCVEELECMLHERLLLSFNTEIEDGSIEEVAEQLMVLHEEHMHGNH